MNTFQVTSIEQLKIKSQGEVVFLPGWDDEPFVARVKRPSMLGLASKGKIPNGLLGAAQKVFTSSVDEKVNLTEIFQVTRVIAEEALVEPTLKQIEEAGVELTDEQLTAILNYSQSGVKALERFRPKQSSDKGDKPE